MRLPFLSFITTLLVLSCVPHASAQTSALSTFATNFSLGSRGPQVVILQQVLNRNLDTRVASAGPGSDGSETDYFGTLTKAAVVRFQEKYAREVLTPVGLTYGNGYVGFYTRTKLNALSAVTASTGSANLPIVSPGATSTAVVAAPPSTFPSPTIAPQNPNLKNLDKFIAAIDNVATKQSIPATTLASIKEQVMKDVATTTDLQATFLKIVQDKSHQSFKSSSFVGGVLATIEQVFERIFRAERARAAAAVPFGGALLFSFYCTQSQTWLITLSPLPPSYAVLLTYVPFSQAFLSYNIPFTEWLLGDYEPGAGVCVAGACPYCVTIPSEGMILPLVGSSPL